MHRCAVGWLSALVFAILPACSHMGPPVVADPAYALPPPPPPTSPVAHQGGAIFHADTAQDLFRDTRAYRVGDILTVTLVEETDAQVRSSTTTAKDDSAVLAVDNLFGIVPTRNGKEVLENFSDASRNFTGTGSSSQSNSLEGALTVVVAQVLNNGNLLVRGEKIVSINQGAEYIRLSGLVRQTDIAPDNTILSTKIANARVSYGGGGALAQSNSQGWLSRFFSSEYWPF